MPMIKTKRWGKCTIIVICLILAGGCMFNSGEGLYSLPQAPEGYLELQEQLDHVVKSGAEYTAPQSGMNTQTVQLVDLDNDGEGEAIACFRESGKERPLKIYIFRAIEEGYETAAVIEGEGTAINSVVYSDITGDGWSEIIVSWQMSAKVQSMSVYSLKGYELQQLMQTEYTKYAMADLDQDGQMEIVTLHVDTGTLGSRADYYFYKNGVLTLNDSVPLSYGIEEIEKVKTGRLYDGVPAVFVDSICGQNTVVTDILMVKNGVLSNVVLDEKTGVSNSTLRNYSVFCGDLDNDGYLEVPMPERLPAAQASDGLDAAWIFHWNLYDSKGKTRRLMTTYHNYTDGWYLRLPPNWPGNKLIISRQDTTVGERTVVFSVQMKGPDDTVVDVPFLKIYKLTGANRKKRSELGERFLLRHDNSSSDTFYVAEFVNKEKTSTFQIEEDVLINQFQLIQSDWNLEA